MYQKIVAMYSSCGIMLNSWSPQVSYIGYCIQVFEVPHSVDEERFRQAQKELVISHIPGTPALENQTCVPASYLNKGVALTKLALVIRPNHGFHSSFPGVRA